MKLSDCLQMIDELNKELDQLLYAISHDLRAPLRAIDGFSLAVVEDYGDLLDETGKNYLERVRGGNRKVNTYIDGLLMISRESRGDMELGEVNLSTLVREMGALVATRYESHQPQFNISENVTAIADRRLMRFCLEKLLDNAWKFTSQTDGARIDFGEIEQDGRHSFFVRDNGVGFDMEYAKERLFGAFQRMHSDDEFGGVGIGLATAKRIINRHGGRIWAESEVNRGTTVFFSLGNNNG